MTDYIVLQIVAGAICGTLIAFALVGTLVLISDLRWKWTIASRRREWSKWCKSVRKNK